MTADEFKEKIIELISKAKLEEAFCIIDKYIFKKSDIWCYELILLQGQFVELDRELNLDIVSRNDYKTSRNSIQFRLLNIIKKLEDTDIAPPVVVNDKETVLIICKDCDDEFYMRSFCNQKKGLIYDVKQLKKYEEPTDHKFIIFDNHSIKNIDNLRELNAEELAHLKLMEYYIEQYSEHKKYMIHFGETTDFVGKNRDIVYAANSKFALYSRIMEMNRFIDDDLLSNPDKTP